MRAQRLHSAAMAFFILGFICANSGWAPVLSILTSDRPDWSVCGEDLCLCVKPTPDKPLCPLCVSQDEQTACSKSEESSPSTPPKRVPRNPHADALTQAGELGCVSVFIAFMFGFNRNHDGAIDSFAIRFIDPDARIALNQPDIPTPPPRS